MSGAEMGGPEAAATCLRVLEVASDGATDEPLVQAAERLQNWAIPPPELQAAVPDGQWFGHVLQLIQQHQQAASSAAGAGASGGSSGSGGSKGKSKRGSSKAKRSTSSITAARKAGGPSLQRSVMEWLDSSLDAVLLSEERGIAMDVVVRMRAIADASVRASSADVVEWRELHSSPLPQVVFAELLRDCEARSGPQLLPIMAPGPNGLACHPSTEPWAQDGTARAALSYMAADALPSETSPDREWPSLELVTSANDAVVAAATARHEEESSELALFVRELGGVCEGWEELAAEARGLAKQCVQPFGDKWQSMLDNFKEDAQLVKQKYDGNKRASKAAQEVRKLELADLMFKQYEEELKQFGTRWLGLFRTSMEDKVGDLLREDAAWLVDRIEGALERVGAEAKAGESQVIPRVRGATITTLKAWKAASALIRDQWSAALEALEDSLVSEDDEFADARDGEAEQAEEEEEESGGSGGFIPAGLRLKWEAATADGWDAKCRLLDDKDFRRRLRKAESKASACMRAALQFLESLLGVPCGSGGGGGGGGSNSSGDDQQMKGPVDNFLITSRKRGSLCCLGAMAILTAATGLATSLDNPVTPTMMKDIGVSNAPKGQAAFETTMAETEAPYRDGVVWALQAMDDCIRASLLQTAFEVARIAPATLQDGSDQLVGEGETFESIEMGVNPAAAKAEQEAAEEKKRREAEKKKKKTAAKNQKRDAERAAQAEAKAKLEAEKRAQAEAAAAAERKAAAARKAEAEAKRARAEADRVQKKKEAREQQRQRRQEMQRQKLAAEKKAAEQAEAEAAAATAAAAVAVVDDLDDGRSLQGRQQRRLQPQPNAQPFVPAGGASVSQAGTQFESRSYTPEAEEQRRVALAEQMAASDAAAKANSEVAQLRQTVAVLQQAIISLPQQSLHPQQHMQHQHTQQTAPSSMYNGAMGGGDAADMNRSVPVNVGMGMGMGMGIGTMQADTDSAVGGGNSIIIGDDQVSGNGSGRVGMGMGVRHVSGENNVRRDAGGVDVGGVDVGGVAAPAAAGTIGVASGIGYSRQPTSMPQSGYRQW